MASTGNERLEVLIGKLSSQLKGLQMSTAALNPNIGQLEAQLDQLLFTVMALQGQAQKVGVGDKWNLSPVWRNLSMHLQEGKFWQKQMTSASSQRVYGGLVRRQAQRIWHELEPIELFLVAIDGGVEGVEEQIDLDLFWCSEASAFNQSADADDQWALLLEVLEALRANEGG